MIFLKKLHIKILSVALLVTLISYNGFESRMLPQQFVSEYVMNFNTSEDIAWYSLPYDLENLYPATFVKFDFLCSLKTFNTIEKANFKRIYFNSKFMKEAQLKASFLTQIFTSSEDLNVTSI